MSTSSKIWESRVVIRFPDCDPFNHLNNARYIDYFINAREDHILANMNFNVYQYAAETGFGWVVSKNQIAYLRPAFLMETVIIDSTALLISDREVRVEMRMWDEKKAKLKSVLWSSFVHINLKTQKPENHSDEMMQLFKGIENPLASAIEFDKRVEQLKSST